MWNCAKCHEPIDDAFDFCWQCGTSKAGVENPEFQRVEVKSAVATEPSPREMLECPKCHARAVIKYGEFETNAHHNLFVEVNENPTALFFKGGHRARLYANVCGKCGFTELYACNPKELLDAYRKSCSQSPS